MVMRLSPYIKDLNFTIVHPDGSSTVIHADGGGGQVTLGRDLLGEGLKVDTSILIEMDSAHGATSTHVPAPKCKATFWVNGVDGYVCTKVWGHGGLHKAGNDRDGKTYEWSVACQKN